MEDLAQYPVEVVAARPVTALADRRTYEWTKRSLDVGLALVLLIVSLPILTGVALAIRLSSKGPVLYRQTRCGRSGAPFECLKFRTMVPDADAYLATNESLRAKFHEHFKLLNDPRVNPVGRILRRSSLDELPQLWNVLIGDMSFVGPRPMPLRELQRRFGDRAEILVSVKPGLTGLWQIAGRSKLSGDLRVVLDLEYIARRSLRFDLAILARTPIAVLTGRGAT